MQETWSPALRTTSYTVTLDPAEAKLRVRGRDYGVERACVSFMKRDDDADWTRTVLVYPAGDTFAWTPAEIEAMGGEVPAWLDSIADRATARR